MKHRVIGIDLGTTYSAVAAFDSDEEQAEVIVDRAEGGAGTTPSVVSYDRAQGKVIVGSPAKRNLPNAPEDTIIEIKREMGVLEETGAGAAAEDGASGEPRKVRFLDEDGSRREFLPQEISALILMKMKQIAEAEIGEEVRDAVVTVPAYFEAPQKSATEQAALLAGMYPHQLIPEPTAAAIGYAVDTGDSERRAYLVFDLGGGTFDVSIITADAEGINVIATAGDPRLGGGDFDNSITAWAVAKLRDEHGLDVERDPGARQQIKYHAEQAKIRLGTQPTTELVLPELRPEQPPVLTLSREEMVELITPDLEKSLEEVEKALDLGAGKGVVRDDIDAVLLVGGSTKMPAVRAMLLDHFRGREEGFIRGDLDPAAVVARGAALLAHKSQPTERAFDIRVEADPSLVNPEAELPEIGHIAEHSLGVGVQENRCVRMIDRQTSLPTSQTQTGFVNAGPTDRLEARVFQGEGEYVYENTYVGTVVIDDLEPKPANSYNFNVTYSLNKSGLLEVSVKEADSGRTWNARFEHGASVRSEDLLDRHDRLKRMFASGAALPGGDGAEPAAPQEAYAGPPPPSPAPEAQAGVGAAEPVVAGSGTAEPAIGGPAEATQPPVTDERRAATESPADTGGGELQELKLDDVPDEFRTYVRRVRRQLERSPDADLARAYNAFAAAVTAKQPEGELIDLGDELTEALDEARRRS